MARPVLSSFFPHFFLPSGHLSYMMQSLKFVTIFVGEFWSGAPAALFDESFLTIAEYPSSQVGSWSPQYLFTVAVCIFYINAF